MVNGYEHMWGVVRGVSKWNDLSMVREGMDGKCRYPTDGMTRMRGCEMSDLINKQASFSCCCFSPL